MKLKGDEKIAEAEKDRQAAELREAVRPSSTSRSLR